MKVAVAGIGYVGLSLAVLLAQRHEVVGLDIVQSKVDLINAGKTPISDKEIQEYLATKELDLKATTDKSRAFKNADYVIIATPTDYDPEKNFAKGVEIIIYEPELRGSTYNGFKVVNELEALISKSDCIVSNRVSPELTGPGICLTEIKEGL